MPSVICSFPLFCLHKLSGILSSRLAERFLSWASNVSGRWVYQRALWRQLQELLKNEGASGVVCFPGGAVVKNPPTMPETQEIRVWSLEQEDPLQEAMAAHSSILAWELPWIEEPGRLLSMRGQRVGHTEHVAWCSIFYIVPCIAPLTTLKQRWLGWGRVWSGLCRQPRAGFLNMHLSGHLEESCAWFTVLLLPS